MREGTDDARRVRRAIGRRAARESRAVVGGGGDERVAGAGRYYAGQELAFKRAVETMTREFFSHCSVEEFELQVREAIQAHGGGAGTTEGKCGMEAQVVKRMIASALDRGAREREMCANAHGDAAGEPDARLG